MALTGDCGWLAGWLTQRKQNELQSTSLPRAVELAKPGCEQMGVGEVAKWGGSVISFSRLDIITSTTRAQITFCGTESLTANCLLKMTEAKGSGQRKGEREGGGILKSLTF